jgi:bacterioferritin-associated ferredoxin
MRRQIKKVAGVEHVLPLGDEVVRLEITDTVTPGQAFVPMHWGSVFASNARVGSLIAPAVDPISGQPELKCAPVRVRRYEPKWYGFALSREPHASSFPSNWLATLFNSPALGDAERMAILAGRAPKGTLESGPVVCSCFAVGRSTLLRAIRGDGLVSIDQIGKALRAGTNCGSCIPELKGLLAESAASAAAPV